MIFLFYNLLVLISGMIHPVHVSICNLDFNENENTVSVKLFKDDFAIVLENNFHVLIDMNLANEKDNSLIISKYINSNLRLELDGNIALGLEFTESKINEEAIWVYFSVGKLNMSENLRITNKLMLDLFEDQTNLVIMNYKGREKGYMFNRNDNRVEIDLRN